MKGTIAEVKLDPVTRFGREIAKSMGITDVDEMTWPKTLLFWIYCVAAGIVLAGVVIDLPL